MNVIAKPRIGNGVPYFIAAGSLAAFSAAAWLAGVGEGRDTRWLAIGAVGLAAVGAATGFLVRLLGLIERRLIEVQAGLGPADSRPSWTPASAPAGVDRYGLPLRPPEVAGMSGGV